MSAIEAAADSGQPAGRRPDQRTKDDFFREIRDAAKLLEFAVAQGRALEPSLIPRIKKGQGFLTDGAVWPSDQDRADFEAAYRDLAQVMQPVTAETLRATEYLPWKGSPANHFSERLYALVFLCAVLILSDQFLQNSPTYKTWPRATVVHGLLPFVYGLVGALTYLLRSAQSYISDRSFDLYRRPEYYNRMVLGFLAGGIVLVFGGQTASVPSDALSFLVGYNTDYLFQLIERLAEAIFPSDSKEQVVIPGLGGLSLVKDTLQPGEAGNATVTLSGKAPSGGVTISLSADAGLTLAAASIRIPEGSTSASFTFKVDPGQAAGTKLHIVAKQDGNSVTAAVTVAPPSP
jgi:hypothetical protein